MTNETKWLSSSRPLLMLRMLASPSDRKLRLFACACCDRLIRSLYNDCCLRAVRVAERYADGLAGDKELIDAHHAAENSITLHGPLDRNKFAQEAAARSAAPDAREAAFSASFLTAIPRDGCPWWLRNMERLSREKMEKAWNTLKNTAFSLFAQLFPGGYPIRAEPEADLLREVFGNPFRPAALDPSCQTETVVAVARAIYEEKRFGDMPVLADALEEAGCTDQEVLAHCRGRGPHVRGCWVLDLIAGATSQRLGHSRTSEGDFMRTPRRSVTAD